MERSKDVPLVSWSAPQCPFGMQYSPRVLDDIRLAVVDAFFLAPRGGVEIGGILLGDFQRKRLRITGYAPVECEHAFGPSFTLSERDQERLAEMLGRRSLPGRRPVGWYHSHTRSEIFFSGADQEIHQRFFPEAWQTALVLRPHTFQPTRAGFFFREADGSIHGEASYEEFVLEPLPPRPAEAEAAPAPAPRRKPARRVAAEPASPDPPAAQPAPDPPPVSVPEPAPQSPVNAEPPRRETPVQAPRWRRGVLLAIAACLAALLLAYQAYDISRLQAELKAQTERANRAEKALADARNQLKMELDRGAASAGRGK
jgi:proteasome lid subunit RPN8/RPN11